MPHSARAAGLVVAMTVAPSGGWLAAQATPDFAAQVLPLLSDRCFACHGPDEQARRADLRLDQRESLLAVGAELLARITSDDVGERMPPRDSNLTLSAGEIELLHAWVQAGAPWEDHWAFVAPTAAEGDDADGHLIDRIVAPTAPPADAATLLRRVTLDLTGLPPSPEDIAAFVADPSDEAYARAVDRLLASEHYGERMAWPWLQAARYADTDGYQADPTRSMWPWRDWLVAALNGNVPFDQLTIEMLAGDLLPEATPEQVLASGFNRNHAYNGEGGRIPEETRVENVFDRTETTATVWLGLTMECARCHDHKFDPISQREYYSFASFFDQTSESGRGGTGGRAPPNMRYLSPDQRAREAMLERTIGELERALDGPDPEVDAAQREWEARESARLRDESIDTAPLRLSPWRVRGPENAVADPFALVALDGSEDSGWRDASEWVDGEVHAFSDTLGATYLKRSIEAPSARTLRVSLGSDDALRVWCNGVLLLDRQVRRGAKKDQDFVELPLQKGSNTLLLEVVNTGGIGGFYFDAREQSAAGLPGDVARALLAADAERDGDLLRTYYRNAHSPRFRELRERLGGRTTELQQLRERAPVVMVMDELPADRRRTTHVLERGGYDQPREAVAAGVPAFLPPLPEGPRDRLALARWIASPDHPLTARVAVNRAWQLFFGRGLVATPEDFGRQGERPSHPELLDALARWFVDAWWDTKALHRLIVTSALYRQTARVGRAAYSEDPDNVDLARGARFRMPSWMLRDQALALSGLLQPALGGPPVRPYQPDGVWREATFDTIRYERDAGTALHRRSVYVFWRRIVGPTSFFDEPGRQTCVVRRTRTNTPLHVLTTWNDETYVEAARAFAERAWARGTDAAQRIAWAFGAATAREPTREEIRLLERRYEASRARFAARPEDAAALLAVGVAPRNASIEPADHAAMTVVMSVILNLDEVVTRP